MAPPCCLWECVFAVIEEKCFRPSVPAVALRFIHVGPVLTVVSINCHGPRDSPGLLSPAAVARKSAVDGQQWGLLFLWSAHLTVHHLDRVLMIRWLLGPVRLLRRLLPVPLR